MDSKATTLDRPLDDQKIASADLVAAEAAEVVSGRLRPGELLVGRFRVIRWIATGRMGAVYEVQDCSLHKRVAIRVIRQEVASDRKAMERFRREISLAHEVTHPNVCRIFDLFYHTPDRFDSLGSQGPGARVTFLTMELLSGKTLDQRLRESAPIPLDEASTIAEQIIEGLAAAHEAGVIHRDLRCNNVVLVEGPRRVRVVVTEFGLDRELLSSSRRTGSADVQEVVGTSNYLAPEQLADSDITPATDIYALGIILFRMTTGRLPFDTPPSLDSQSASAPRAKRLDEAPPTPRKYAKKLDPRWESAILKCLERNPERRFSSVREVLSTLHSEARVSRFPALRTMKHLAARLGFGDRHFNFDRSLGLRAAGLGAGLLSIPFLLGTFETNSRSTQPELQRTIANHPAATRHHSIAVLGFMNLSGDPAQDWLSTTLTELLTTELAAGGKLRPVSGEDVARLKRELDLFQIERLPPGTLANIGQRLKSHYVVLGTYFMVDHSVESRLHLDLKIQDTATGETLWTLKEIANQSELLDLVTRLGAGLRHELSVAPLAEQQQPETTASGSQPIAPRLQKRHG